MRSIDNYGIGSSIKICYTYPSLSDLRDFNENKKVGIDSYTN